MAVDWGSSYAATWRAVRLNVNTWNGTEELSGLKSLKLSNKADDSVPKLQSGTMTVDIPAGESFVNGWYRIQVVATSPTGSTTMSDMATLLFEADSGSVDYKIDTITAKGQSVLKPVEDSKMEAGVFIRRGENGGEWCRDMVLRHTPAPVVLDGGGFTVDRYYVFDSGTSVLSAVWKVLDSANWIMQIHGDGTIHILKRPSTVSHEIGMEQGAYLTPGIDHSLDISSVINSYHAKLGYYSATAINDDPNSPSSTVNRTYVKNEVDTNPIPIDGETLQQYVNRRLEEESVVYKLFTYNRGFWDDVYPFDLLRINFPDIEVGEVRVISQSIECGEQVTFEEEVGMEVKLWEAP